MLFEDFLPLWSTVGADWARGGFCESISPRGRAPHSTRRIRVSARQVYVFCEAEKLGWNSAAAAACVQHGLRFLHSHCGPDGLLFHRLSEDGHVEDHEHDLYDQAFLLFSYAHAYRLLRDDDLKKRALNLLAGMRRRLGHHAGGFRDHTGKPFPLRANPHMHLLEAALAWMSFDGDPAWEVLGGEMVSLFNGHFFDPLKGVVREMFSPEWEAVADENGYRVEPGHNYEWAWLLLRWSEMTGEDAIGPAQRMVTFAERHGYQKSRRVAINEVWSDGTVADGKARLWPQTERLKAWLALAKISDGQERHLCEVNALDAASSLLCYFNVGVLGTWHDVMHEDGSFQPGLAPASSLYHVMCALSELSRYVDHRQLSEMSLADQPLAAFLAMPMAEVAN